MQIETKIERANYLRIVSWALYDFANTIFSMNIISLYFTLWVTVDKKGEDIYYSIAITISTLAVAFSMPVIGALSDQRHKRMPFLISFTLMCVIFTAAIGLVDDLFWGLFFFIFANYGFGAGLVVYDALLPLVSRGAAVGKVAGLGVGLGYLGAIGGLLLVKPFVDSEGRSSAFIPTAVLFLIFSLPTFIFVKDEISAREFPHLALRIKRSFKKIIITIQHARRYPGLLGFLIANLIYSNTINTVIIFMSVYASKVIGFDDKTIRLFLITSTTFAVIGSFIFGFITDYLNAKRTLMIVLILWIVSMTAGVLVHSQRLFWFIGPVIGISLGATWVSARALVVDLTPTRKLGEVYGLYNMGGKFGNMLGPLVWGGTTLVFSFLGDNKYRIALLFQIIFLLIGLIVLSKIPYKKTRIND